MKVELLNENKVKITLTVEELEKRNITLEEIKQDSNIIIDLIKEIDIHNEFPIDDDSESMIETFSDRRNSLIVTITKIENIPDLKKYCLLDDVSKQKRKKGLNHNISYYVDSNIFSFSSLDQILNMCEAMKSEKIFCGKNSLYKYNDSYFLIFSIYSTRNPKFLKTFVILSEYCQKYYSLNLFSTLIKEKAKLIIKDNALQKLRTKVIK